MNLSLSLSLSLSPSLSLPPLSPSSLFSPHALLDCRDNASLQDQYHPGVFTNSKWSCCDHKSKHSTGCQPTTNFCQQPPNSIPPLVTSQPPSSLSGRLGGGGGGGGGRAHRGPLPPTPIDELSPSSSNQLQPPSSRESYFQNHRGPRPNAPYSYEHHSPQEGPSVGHRSGRNPSPDPAPPPVPVSRQYILYNIHTCVLYYTVYQTRLGTTLHTQVPFLLIILEGHNYDNETVGPSIWMPFHILI